MSDDTTFRALQLAVAGEWSIERELGRGGMGTVYLAREVALDRLVAIKLLHAELAADPVQRQRFLREAQTVARLSHPNIVPVYDVVEREELVFIVMGFVDGEPLGARLRREGPLASTQAERLLREVAWALAAAHATGVLHRDISAENVLIERRTGRALLVDFGIAAELDGGDAGPLVGTPAYLAPELICGEPPTPMADLYALGVVGFQVLTGRLPYAHEDTARLLMAHVKEPVPSLDRAAASAPSRLRRGIERLLAKSPSERPSSAEEWLAGLESPESTAIAEPLQRWLAGRDAARPYYAVALTLIGMLGAASVMMWTSSPMSPARQLLQLFMAVAALPVIIQVGMALRGMRQVQRLGYRLEDLRVALDRLLASGVGVAPVEPSAMGRLVRRWTWVMAIVTVVTAAHSMFFLFTEVFPWTRQYEVYVLATRLMPISWVLAWTGIGIGLLVPGTRKPAIDWRTRVRHAFWHSRLGGRVHALITVGTRPGQEISTLHRPTELVLGLQIEDLWRALPPESRRQLDGLPGTADALRRRIDEVRHVLAALGDRSDAADHALRQRLVARRDAALGALEQLRLQLLRLAGEVGAEGELTVRLREARAVEHELLLELGADPAMAALLRRPRHGRTLSHSPTPTPA